MKIVLSFVKTATALLMLLVSISAEAAEIRIIASPGLSAAFEVLGPQFERATGHTLAMQYGLIVVQKQQIEAGAFDLAIVPSLVLDDAIKQGKITADTRTPVARVSVGVGVRANTAKPDLTSTDAFKRALLNAKSVSYVTDEPTGRHIAKEFERLGIADAMKAKTKSQETTARVWQAVASGEVELGFGFTSNALSVRGVELAGLFPPELQYSAVLTAGVSVAARQADGAKALIKYLLAPEAAAVMKTKGLEPAAP
jgi:molybdate transport system substrate-binding protein